MNYNEKKYKNYKLRKILRIFVMLFSIATITLAILNLVIHLSIFYALIFFVITGLLTKYRNSLDFKTDKKNVTTKSKKK